MSNLEYLMKDLLPWAEVNKEPIQNLTFRCFEHIEQNVGLLAKYNALVASLGAKPNDKQVVNQKIAQLIANHFGLVSNGELIKVDKNEHLIESYHQLTYK